MDDVNAEIQSLAVPPPPRWTRVTANFSPEEYQNIAILAKRTGMDPSTAASRAVVLLMTDRMYGGAAPAEGMIPASRAQFPRIEAEVPITFAVPRSADGSWPVVEAVMLESDYAYLNTAPGGSFDRTGWTIRNNILAAVEMANGWLNRREYDLSEPITGPPPPPPPPAPSRAYRRHPGDHVEPPSWQRLSARRAANAAPPPGLRPETGHTNPDIRRRIDRRDLGMR